MSKSGASKETVWEYRENRWELDLQDAEAAARYEAAFAEMAEDERNLPREGSAAVLLQRYCALFFDMFSAVLNDPDAPQKLFGGAVNARLCEDAYVSFLEFVKAQGAAEAERRSALLGRYAPGRVARRG